MQMPEPDAGVISRRSEIIARIRDILPGDGVIVDEEDLPSWAVLDLGHHLR